MGNNTSQIRRSSITYNESNVRKSNTSQQPKDANLDEEFSDLILHEIKKDDIKNQNFFNKDSVDYNKFLNDLIEDEFNELNDLIETEESELTRNIIPNKDNDPNDTMDSIDDLDSTINYDNMDIDTEMSQSNTSDIQTPDFSQVDFTKIISDNNMLPNSAKPIQSTGIIPSRGNNLQPGQKSKSQTQFQNKQTTNMSQLQSTPLTATNEGVKLVSVEIKWVNIANEKIQKVSIIGSFSNWRNTIRLKPSTTHPNEYVVTIRLPLGVHKLLYIINNEYRVSEQLPTATDQEGIFFNWFEVLDELHLFNHSSNQPNRTNASTNYDANIIQNAGQFEINEIKKKSNSFLTKISKEEPNFEHVEFMDNDDSDDMQKELQNELLQESQMQEDHLQEMQQQNNLGDNQGFSPQSAGNTKLNPVGQHQGPYISLSDHNSSSFLVNQNSNNKLQYSNEIPEIFVNYNYFKSQNANFELPEPPQLPAHLNNVLLNKISNNSQSQLSQGSNPHSNHIPQIPNPFHSSHESNTLQSMDSFKPPTASFMNESPSNKRPPLRRADSSYYASNQEAYHLSIPNHVILNHLMTTSIRNDVLTVACITRYSGKFVTQIMHSPADTM